MFIFRNTAGYENPDIIYRDILPYRVKKHRNDVVLHYSLLGGIHTVNDLFIYVL